MKKLIPGLVLLSGCITQVPIDKNYPGPEPRPVHEKIKKEIHQQTLTTKEKKHFTLSKIKLQERIDLEYYKTNENNPTIIVLPQLKGLDFLARYFATHFAKNDYNALFIRLNEQSKRLTVDNINDTVNNIIEDHIIALDWLEQNYNIEQLGVMGISSGGLTASILSGLEERIDAAILGVTGGDLPYIIMHSKVGTVQRIKKTALAKVNEENLYSYLQDLIEHDPLKYAKNIDARNVLMILANNDKCVPIKKGEELRKEIGYPRTIYLPTGHYTSAIYCPYLAREAVKFFNEKL